MTQDIDPVAGAEAPVVETAPENQGDDTQQGNAEQALYEDDQPDPDDLEEQQDDQDDAPEPVEAPASLKAEEKEQFAQLPPEAQRFAADILARRDQETQQGLQAARVAQQNAERSAADTVAQTTQQFAAQFAQLVQAFQPEPPPVDLARENPQEYLYLKALHDEQMGTYSALVQQITGLHGQSEQHFAAQRQTWLQDQDRQLRAIPEYASDETRASFMADLGQLGMEIGYAPEDLNNAGAKDVLALTKIKSWKADAERWRQHKAKRNERPRAAAGRFAAAPAGNGAPAKGGGADAALKALYPND